VQSSGAGFQPLSPFVLADEVDRPGRFRGRGFFTVNLAERKLTLLTGYLGPKQSGDREETGFARAQPILRAVTVSRPDEP
jgi:hypothetical protein